MYHYNCIFLILALLWFHICTWAAVFRNGQRPSDSFIICLPLHPLPLCRPPSTRHRSACSGQWLLQRVRGLIRAGWKASISSPIHLISAAARWGSRQCSMKINLIRSGGSRLGSRLQWWRRRDKEPLRLWQPDYCEDAGMWLRFEWLILFPVTFFFKC